MFAVITKSASFAPVKPIPVIARVAAPAALETVTVWARRSWYSRTGCRMQATLASGQVRTAVRFRRETTFDQPEDTDPRMAALYVWDIFPAQPLSTAWTL